MRMPLETSWLFNALNIRNTDKLFTEDIFCYLPDFKMMNAITSSNNSKQRNFSQNYLR